ncbi:MULTISPECIES: helix-turn-helix domain-containing protein [Moraxella]|uniref:Transcriptional regulator n=1 Tax=Moraxella lacunata TaxID=477 RepID=A0A1B8PV76_MORLA|nr:MULTISPECIES: helix-turn-helix transcriptional regulator [Moraxella]MBE9579970.1 helix-turn-helix transcriptional regulator [Moraxella sp. K1664]MBE9589361.1 helix-turn-helix transcriptional regulator [Moraxella sp. K1630]MBE9597639.1 helix-turn-helix transcriptional regulator [Moraxella sp. K2450]MDH9220135.1 helix-turn-helix transcriptional regulator [Moraxella lacunata]MDI4484124.1 XRE family transcriptional regulator [Moraxella lacunata]
MATLEQLLNKLSPEQRAEVERNAEAMILDYQLHQLREELELSQKQLAEAMGITQPTLSAIENRGAEIKLSTLKRYVETMGGKLRIDVELPTGKHVGFNI